MYKRRIPKPLAGEFRALRQHVYRSACPDDGTCPVGTMGA